MHLQNSYAGCAINSPSNKIESRSNELTKSLDWIFWYKVEMNSRIPKVQVKFFMNQIWVVICGLTQLLEIRSQWKLVTNASRKWGSNRVLYWFDNNAIVLQLLPHKFHYFRYAKTQNIN